MSLIQRMLIHTVVYWAPKAADAYGQATFEEPVELKARWHNHAKEVIDDGGTRRKVKAKVFVESDVAIGGYLLRGTLLDLVKTQPPPTNAYEIIEYKGIPKIRGNETARWALL